MRSMNIPFLHQTIADKKLIESLGGKAKNLNELLIHGFPIPDGFILQQEVLELEAAIEKIGGFPVAVRSSGTLEDMADASFAGLYETFLFIKTMDDLRDAVTRCFDSKNSARVKDYLKTKNIQWSEKNLNMSVLVQKMIDASIAGVLFTMNPINGFEEECYLEFCQGVGERLVSGHVTPSRIRYNWIEEKVIQEDTNQEGTLIHPDQLKKLIDLCVDIQAHYGKPQDIEWAIDSVGTVYILQSRPVTSFTPREDRPELTNADLKDGGVSARACTPCMLSSYRDAMQISMGDYFKRIRLISNDESITWAYSAYGRVYWNAEAVKTGLKRLPDFKEEDFDRDLGIQKDYGPSGPHVTEVCFSTVFGAVPVLISLHREFNDCLSMIENFRPRFETRDREFKRQVHNLSSLDDQQFSTWLLDVLYFQQETERNYFRTIYNNSNFQTEFKNFIKRLSAYEPMDEVDLMGELQGIAHLDVQSGLAELNAVATQKGYQSPEYVKARKTFLEHHYHHGPAELDITVQRWGENMLWVDSLVKDWTATDGLKKDDRLGLTEKRLTAELGPLKKNKFYNMLRISRNFLRLREEMRSFSTRGYYLLRLALLDFGRRFGFEGNKVFFLELKEVGDRLRNPEFKFPDLRKRELLYQSYRNFKAPNEFGGTILALKTSTSAEGLKGLGCSPGEFTGKARVITDIHQTSSLTKNDILVTYFTDPGWTPVLARVGGVITEVGGLLSHAAVIGREYGIPAVLNLIDATKLIRDGDIIKINGKTGLVEILEKKIEN